MKQYVVKRFEFSPFSKSLENQLILCDLETGEPFADIEYGEKLVKEGDVISEEGFTVRATSMKVKHLVAGDIVFTEDMMYQGRITSIVWDEWDTYSSVVTLEDIELSPQGRMFEHTIVSFPKTMLTSLRKITVRPWISATIPCPCCGR